MTRRIEPKLVDYIDKKLSQNGAAQEALKQKNARKVFVFAAEALLGIREATGRNDGKMVELIQETVGGHGQEPWCMSYVQSCLAYAELKCDVISPIVVSEHCWTVWAQTPKSQRVKTRPLRGAIVIWNYPPGTNGHTGIVDEYEHKKGKMLTLEGNTVAGLRPDGTIEREGGGTYMAERSITGNSKMRVLGFLKPF